MKDERNKDLDKVLNELEIDDILDNIKNKSTINEDPLEPPRAREQISSYQDFIIPPTQKEFVFLEDRYEEEVQSKDKKANTKKIIIAIVAVILVIAIGFGIFSYASTAYLRPYKDKYGIDFPKGIPEEFCDKYGENQEFTGKLDIIDGERNIYIYSQNEESLAHFDGGSTINKPQQFRAISISKDDADIEALYSSMERYKRARQRITFTNIYGKEENYQVVAAYYVTTVADDDDGYLFPYNLYGDLTEDSFNEYEDRITTRSLYYTGYDMSYSDSFLTISADSDFMDNFRFVVLCVKVDGDVTPLEHPEENKNIHYPQVWYDVNKKHNSYWLASKWQPTVYTDEKHKVTEQQ